MNVVGQLGEFFIRYQEPIQIGVILVFIAVVILLIIKGCRHAGERKRLLSDIHDTVKDIGTAVNGMASKEQSEAKVIYIDGRPHAAEASRETAAEAKTETKIDAKPPHSSKPQKAMETESQPSVREPEETASAAETETGTTVRPEPAAEEFSVAGTTPADRTETAVRADAPDAAETVAETDPADQAETAAGTMPADETKAAAGPEPVTETEDAARTQTTPETAKPEKPAQTEEAAKHYFNRNCNVSKNGRVYTVEELNQQIKE